MKQQLNVLWEKNNTKTLRFGTYRTSETRDGSPTTYIQQNKEKEQLLLKKKTSLIYHKDFLQR